eukprot:g902.t1
MPAPRYVDAVRNGSSPRKKDFNSHGSSTTTTAVQSMNTEQQDNRQHKAIVRLPHDPRFIYPFAAATGRRVIVQVKSGVEFEGILYSPVLGTKNIHITLKDARRLKQKNSNGTTQSAIKGTAEFYETLIIPSQEFVQMKASGIPTRQKDASFNDAVINHSTNEHTNDGLSQSVSESSTSKFEVEEEVIPVRDENDMAGFEGDIQRISQRDSSGHLGRDLVPWNACQDEGDLIELEELGGGGTHKSHTNWNQFEANEAVVESTFSMEQYSSKLDVTKSKYTEEEAARLAKEIEESSVFPSTSILDDSGINEEVAEEDLSHNKAPSPPPVIKPFSWADAVKGGKSQRQSIKQTQQVIHVRKQEVKEDSLLVKNNPSLPPDPLDTTGQLKSAHQMDTGVLFFNTKDSGNEQQNSTHIETNASEESAQNKLPALESVWGENTSIDDTSKDEFQSQIPSSPPGAAPIAPRAETRKPASTVVPGISFKDKLKTNLKSKPVQIAPMAPPVKPRTTTGPVQESQGPVMEKTGDQNPISAPDPVVQSPKGGAYAGKLITCPASSTSRYQERSNVSTVQEQQHLMTSGLPHEVHRHPPPPPPPPMAMGPPHPMYFAHKPPPPGAVPMMPLAPPLQTSHPPPGYREMVKEGPARGVVYGGFGSPLDSSSSVTPSPHGVSMVGHEGDEVAGRRAFQLNPMAKSYKPTVSLPPGAPQSNEYYVNGQRFSSGRGEMNVKANVSPVESPQATGTPSSAPVQMDNCPPAAEFVASQGLAPQPPYIPPNVVTPWPSFPGTGVWHSGLGTPRPGAPGFIPPGMPGAYPVFMPGVSPFMGAMQEPMWRHPPPGHPPMHGMPDQQSLAMMWGNYYSQLVPPNKRMWNSAKGPSGNAAMLRQGRNARRPPPQSGQSNVEM